MDTSEQEKNEMDDKIPMIPKHQAQAEMMHMSWTIRWLVVAVAIGFICMVIMASVFVSGYTSRTKDWLNTYAILCHQNGTEAANEKEPSGTVQQLPLP